MDAPVLTAQLLLLLDSRSPAGGHHHSGGMEAAVNAGFVSSVADVDAYCTGRLRTAGLVAAGFAAAACRGWTARWSHEQWHDLDQELSARTPSQATRAASRSLGAGLRRLLMATVPYHAEALTESWAACPAPAPHHSLVLGAGVAMVGGDPGTAARAAALAACTAPASAAVRLLGLDPYAVHFVLARLAPLIDEVADTAVVDDELPDDSAPAMELLAEVHARTEVRLFAS
jgi:urease accessory protein